MIQLTFYNCGGCGYLSTKNFRDDGCPMCKVVASSSSPVKQINISEHSTPDGYGSKVTFTTTLAPYVYPVNFEDLE